jgi:tRNA1(Val) A37 N6-methylase TrmN6
MRDEANGLVPERDHWVYPASKQKVLEIAAGNATLAAARRARYTSAVDRDAQAADRRPANSNREVIL